MTKTTIDGLAVRSKKQPVRSTTTRATSGRSVSSKQRIDQILQEVDDEPVVKTPKATTIQASSNDFLEPVSSFPGGDIELDTNALKPVKKSRKARPNTTARANQDWSDLLDQMTSEAEDFADSEPMATDWENGDAMWGKEALLEDDFDLVEEKPDKSRKKASKDKKKHGKKKNVGKRVALALVIILVIGLGVLYFWGDSLISKLTGGRSSLFDTLSAMMSSAVPFKTDENGRTNILVFGTEGYNMSGETAYGVHDGSQLTDSIMIISIDQETKDVALISLPRDLKVSLACSAGKVNEVFWCKNQDGTDEWAGASALMEQVGEVFGLEFQYFAHVNWGSLVDIVDQLGGITVTLDEDINDYEFTGAVIQAGVPVTLNGEQALGLARARHGTMGGDFSRGNSQQKIVMAIVEKAMQDGVSIPQAFGLLNILGDNLRTNFSSDNIKSGVQLLTGFSIDKVRQIPLVDYDNNIYYVQTANINDISYVVPTAGVGNYAEIHEYIDRMLSNDPVKRENTQVVVYNASETFGAAANEKKSLEADGVNVTAVSDAQAGICEEKYCIYQINDKKSATRALLENKYSTTVWSAAEIPDGLMTTGADFVIVIGEAEEV